MLTEYLPKQFADDELVGLVALAVEEVTAALGSASWAAQLGQVMRGAKVASRAEGGRGAAAVKAALAD
ncbi:GatB/YqeY domain-containing protein [Actinokineospora sp. NBRC 105648]|uniref:GatB/YqeY domain-containing protein n=1 Tax=Actinokineospora sp. NBRC 105648 TaxID=3032206 RepID=UPI0024A42CDE|nr:GatB/YqeY domain-containing protein [Actinokineospora sp. NBRC 105648]GLZ40942.1 hypothetical protein Acsp05_45660 [Actinokineospora sp. NBRC 105648]